MKYVFSVVGSVVGSVVAVVVSAVDEAVVSELFVVFTVVAAIALVPLFV